MREIQVLSLGREDPLEKEMETHSSTLAWRVPWREEPGRLQSMGSQRVGHDWATELTEWSSGFPHFLQFKSEFGNKEFLIWATISSQSCFCWLYRASPSLASRNIINVISVLTIWWCPCVESSLVLLEEGVCYDQGILLAKLYWPLPCFILFSKVKFTCYSRLLLDLLLLHSSTL